MPVLNSLTFTLADQVWETTQTSGTGSYVLDGAKVNLGITYRTFLSALGNGVRTGYTITQGANKEIALGTVSSPNTLSRDSILFSTNSNNAVSWSAGVKDIQCDISAALANQIWAKPSGGFSTAAIETRGPFAFSGSQTVMDITGIAATARILYLAYSALNPNAQSAGLFLQLGDSGGIETTGYTTSIAAVDTGGSPSGFSGAAGFNLTQAQPAASSLIHSGAATLTHISAGLWAIHGVSHSQSNIANYATSTGGAKTLSGTLDRIRIGCTGVNFVAGGSIGLQIIHAV